MSLGNNILKLRKKSGLSQEQLGEKIKVSRQTISNWEIDKTFPNSEQLKMISKELNVSIDELLNNNIELKQEILEKSKKNNKKLNTWQIIFLVLGSPIWLSLLIAIFSIILSVYIALWAVVISFWATFGSVFGVALYMILTGIAFAFGNNNLTGLAMISVGVFCVGLAILLFFGCKLLTKSVILIPKKVALWSKNCFLKKEVA